MVDGFYKLITRRAMLELISTRVDSLCSITQQNNPFIVILVPVDLGPFRISPHGRVDGADVVVAGLVQFWMEGFGLFITVEHIGSTSRLSVRQSGWVVKNREGVWMGF